MDVDWRQELATLLHSTQTADWDRARSLRLSKIPDRLCRYRQCTERHLQMLEAGTIWLAPASSFNDLHDTAVVMNGLPLINESFRRAAAKGELPEILAPHITSETADPQAVIDELFLQEIAKELGPEKAEKARGFFTKVAVEHSRQMSRRISDALRQWTKIACFSEASDDPAMWAHYSADHTGFCVEYDFQHIPRDDLRVFCLYPVLYVPQLFDMTTLAAAVRDGAMTPFLPLLAAIHKAPTWATEREWRIVIQLGPSQPGLEWLMPRPARLLLGHRIEKKHRDRIGALAAREGIPIFEMIPAADRPALIAQAV